jgi:hypothetical protein
MNGGIDLERRLGAAQAMTTIPAATVAARLEWALAETSRAVAESVADHNPRSQAGVHLSRAGIAIFAGAGSPFTQGMATGSVRSRCVRLRTRASTNSWRSGLIERRNGSSCGRGA